MCALGEMTGKTGERFRFVAGLDGGLVAQLKKYSLDMSDEELQAHTSDHARFGTGSYEEWYAKDRVPFALIHEATGDLAALAWFGPKPLGRKSLKHLSAEERSREMESVKEAGEWHTIVYRAYRPYRGQGLMKQFVRACMDAYKAAFPKARLWAGVDADNEASIGLASALGFVIDEEQSDRAQRHLVMVCRS